jgi:hypothetical protein
MKRLEFTCEGCDLTEYVTLPTGGQTDVTLDGWVAHHVVMQEDGSVIFENSADLCPACAEKMRHAINPANWPRIDPAMKQFAPKRSAN